MPDASILDALEALTARLGEGAAEESKQRRENEAAEVLARQAAFDARHGGWVQVDPEKRPDTLGWIPPALPVEVEDGPILVVTSRRQGAAHVVATRTFIAGRIKRERGEALCSDVKKFGRLRSPPRTVADISCQRCKGIVQRLKLDELLCRDPNLDSNEEEKLCR